MYINFKTLHNRIVILKGCFIFYSVASKTINLKLIQLKHNIKNHQNYNFPFILSGKITA